MKKFLISWYDEIPVAGFIWTLSPDGFKTISACYPAELDKLQESVRNIIVEILLVIQDYVLQCFYYLLQNTRERAYIIKTFGIFDHCSFIIFFIRKAIWRPKNTVPVARGFSSWLAAVASVAVLMGSGNEGLRSSGWKCPGRSPVRFSLQARWVVVCQETGVTGGMN